ncbi:MAG TPA: hypothetical protein VNZ61_15735 [Roseomonas sp.]|nr:hypothetical protein [Roseomonas sp.]
MPPLVRLIAQAERRLQEVEARVENWRSIITKLERDNPSEAAAAYWRLAILEEELFLARAHRDKLREGL